MATVPVHYMYITTCRSVHWMYLNYCTQPQDGYAPLHYAAKGGHTTCMKQLLSTPGINVNIQDKVSWSI